MAAQALRRSHLTVKTKFNAIIENTQAEGHEQALTFKVPPCRLSSDEFKAKFGDIYERCEWVAEKILLEGVSEADTSVEHLASRMKKVVDEAGYDKRLALLRAHPELQGRLTLTGELSAASASEQASAGLYNCSPEEFAQFQRLNARYRAKFGHPFFLAVRGLTRAEVLEKFAQRVENDADTEFSNAFQQIHKRARLRLGRMGKAEVSKL
ncbi:2-oxo-4-hydroxy-4-carboxy-5-ureidoimidazoline decarboxylase-like [Sycon ciliatum]|uniref:2-oxo-4-hydroxy-4-carboxy-5-ureidoimidazoline decarboxylase-like n=1 Tax=Sycon ciliatum TaxID=27933 RepID=UPI0020AB1FB1